MAIQAGEDTFYQAKRGIVQNGLVLNLDADASRVSGTTLYDLTGRGNDGALQNATITKTQNGKSISLDGTDDSCFVSSTGDVSITTLTISVWVKKETLNTLQYILTKTVNKSYELSSHTNNGIRYRINNGATTVFNVTSLLNDSDWHNVAVTHDGSSVVFYFDGQQNTTGTGTISNETSGVMIGANVSAGSNTAAGQYFSGKIAVAQIYNRALTAAEVLHNYNATRRRFGV